jgi:FKBP-type peptidyl-prolyl cis-trans isomerase
MLTTLFAASVLLRDPQISIKEIKAGTGTPAAAKDRVVVQYTGKLAYGARERGPIPPNSPLKFEIERVVKP